jgi:Lar family restriction alleviation protein
MKENKTLYLPCPFCGHECNDDYLEIDGEKYGHDFKASCGYCGASAERGDSVDEAINNWNTRSNLESSEFIRGYMAAKRDIIQNIEVMKNEVD